MKTLPQIPESGVSAFDGLVSYRGHMLGWGLIVSIFYSTNQLDCSIFGIDRKRQRWMNKERDRKGPNKTERD